MRRLLVVLAVLLITSAAAVASAQTLGQSRGPDFGTYSIGPLGIPLAATGGDGTPYMWEVVAGLGSLPPGVSLRTDIPLGNPPSLGAALVGIATAPGMYAFTLRVKSGGDFTDQQCTLTISLLAVQDSYQLPDAFVLQSYLYRLTAVRDGNSVPAIWTLLGGIPPGMTLHADGSLEGAPTAPGFYDVSFSVSDGAETVYRHVSLIVSAINIVTPGVLPNAMQGASYTTSFSATGGSGSFTYGVSGFTGSLTLNASSGELSGVTDAGTGPFSFTVTATDTSVPPLSYSKRFSIDVLGVVPSQPIVTNFASLLPDCTIGVPCSRSIGVSGGGTAPFTWTAQGLPPGMAVRSGSGITSSSISPGDVEIWGTPTATGVYSITLTVTDANGVTAINTFPLFVSVLLEIDTLPNGTIETPYAKALRVIGGTAGYTASQIGGQLPLGLTLDAGGAVSGTPHENGDFNLVARFTDSTGRTLQVLNAFAINGGGASTIPANASNYAQKQFTLSVTPRDTLALTRTALTPTISWNVDTDGFWDVAGNWRDSNGASRVPTASDDVLIDRGSANPTVTVRSGNQATRSLLSNEPLIVSGGSLTLGSDSEFNAAGTLSGGTLALNAHLKISKTITLAGGTIQGGTVSTTGGAVLVVASGTLDGVTLGALVGGVPASATVQSISTNGFSVTGGLTFANGSLLDLGNQMTLVGDQTLGGGGEIRFRGTNGEIRNLNQTTFGPGLTIHRADAGTSSIFMVGGSITNQGTIRADAGGRISVTGNPGATFTNGVGGVLAAEGGTLSLLSMPWNNAGHITVTDSTLNLGGSFTTAGLGAYTRTTFSTINLVGRLDNTSRTLSLDATTGSWNLDGGTLSRGSLVTSGGAVLVVKSGTLDGVTLGALVGGVPASATVHSIDSNGFSVTGGLTFANGSLLELGNQMTLVGDQTLGGGGEIRFRGTNGEIRNLNQTTFSPGLTIHRADAGTSSIFMVGGSITNQGTIRADAGGRISVTGNPGATFTNGVGGVLAVEGGTLSLLSMPWNNAGHITVTDSTLNLGGSFTTAGLGAYTRTTFSTINLVGRLDNTSRTLSLDATTGSWNLDGGTLSRGSLVTSGGAVLVVKSGTLDGVTLGALVGGVPASATVRSIDSNGFSVTGGLTFANGSLLELGNQMTLVGDQTLGGGGEIQFRTHGEIRNLNQTTFGPGLTMHRADEGNTSIFMIGGSITNRGTIRADAGGRISVTGNAGTTFTNAVGGVLAAEGGTLLIDTNTTNYVAGTLTGGTWQAVGNSTLRITGPGITTNAASIVLDGVGAKLTKDTLGTSALANLSSNAAAGRLTIRNGATFSTAGSFTNNGSLTLGPAGTFTTNGTFTQGNAAALAVEIGGPPASGQFGRLVTTGTAALHGTLDVRLVNGYGPAPGLSFPVLSFTSRTGDFTTINGLSVGGVPIFGAVFNPTNLVLNTLVMSADLVFDSATPPAAIAPGQMADVPYTIRNRSGTPAAGEWFDTLYLSTDNVLDPSDVLLGVVKHSGGVGGNASYNETLRAVVPGVAERDYRVIVFADSRRLAPEANRDNNQGASAATTSVRVPALGLDQPQTVTIANGQDIYYKLVAPPGTDIKINADFAAPFQAELYVRYGNLPDRTNFDHAAAPGDLHPVLALANPLGGAFYVLLHGREGAASAALFTLTAATAGFEIIRLSPTRGSNQSYGLIQLFGSQFTPRTTVTLQRPGVATRTSQSVEFVDSTHLKADFDLKGLPTGSYSVSANDAGQTAVALDTFTVTNDPSGFLSFIILSPEIVRVGSSIVVTIHVRNGNNAQAFAPFIVITASNVDAGQTREERGSPPDMLPDVIAPLGETAISITYKPDPKGDLVRSGFNMTAINPSLTLLDWDGLKNTYRPSTIPADAWDAIWANIRPELGNTLADEFALLRRDSNALARLGIFTKTIDRLFNFELRKANDLPALPVPAGAVDLAFPAPGLSFVFGRGFGSSIAARYHLGRLGRGWVDNLDISIAENAASGLVTLRQGDSLRAFARQLDNSYASFPGDHATLTKVNGAFRLAEQSGAVTAFRIDGMLDYLQDTNSNRLTAGYSGTQLTSLTHSNGSVLKLAYNVRNRLSQVTDPAGRVANYAYDVSGEHLVSVTTPDGTTEYTYAPAATGPRAHALASISYRDGTHLFFAYDSHGRLARQERNGGAQALTFTYDATSYSVTDAFGHSTQSFFDDSGRIVAAVDPLDRVEQMNYDTDNNLVSALIAGNPPAQFEYDTRGNAVRALDPLGQHQEFDYETTFNNLTSWRDALGHPTDFSYDANGNLLTITAADGTSGQFAYDAQGNVVGSVNRRGQTITYTYDSRGLPTSKTLPDGTHVDYVYDDRGNMISATDAAGGTIMNYDMADRMTRITYPSGRFLEYTYDTGGRRIRTRDRDGFTVNYRYDEVGRLAELTDDHGQRIVAYAFNAAGRLTRENRGNGTFTTYGYDEAGQLLHLVNAAPDTTVLSRFDYIYDGLGRRTSMTTLEGKTSYGYDAAGRLTSVSLPSGRTITYAYDAQGNRKTVTDNGASTAYTANNLNQYVTIGAASQGFDADGDQLSSSGPGASRNYTYDVEGRLVSIVTPQDTWTYAYDALGNRVASTHNGVQTQYLIDPSGLGNVAAEYDGAGNLRAHYVQGAGLVSRVDAGGPPAYYQFDAAGNTAQLTGAGGAVLNSYSYLPFGERLSASETVSNPFTYVGQFGVMREGSGLDFMRNRWYDPAQGRFTQSDPIGLRGGTNFYAYVNNNPVHLADPSGLGPQDLFTTGVMPPEVEAGLLARDAARAAAIQARAAVDLARSTQTAEVLRAETAAWVNWVNSNKAAASGGTAATLRAGYYSVAAVQRAVLLARATSALGRGLQYGVIAAGVAVIAFEAFYFGESVAEIFGADTPECLPVVPRFLQPGCKEAPKPFNPVGGGLTSTVQRDPSKDPNDIVGPAGFGAGRFVQNGTLPYSILFENKPEATGPAALVVITDRLDDDLDLDTFALGDLGFGDVNVSVPAGRQFYRSRLDLRAARGVFVDVTAELDRPTRVVTWTLTAIDPKTLDIPSDPSVGFLPPDKNQPEGQGYVNYFVAPKADSPTGTRIDAQATIVFESNAPIDTPTIFNTLDVGEPESSVSALPAVTNTTSFTVSWFGSDDAGGAPGSGVSLFDVFVSDNGGSFTPFQTGTIATSATFHGAFEHTYRFYSVATDNVGHREMKAGTADASTTIAVTAPAPPTAVYDVFTTSFQTPLVVAAPGVLGNDAPNGGGPMSAALVTNVTRGILVFAADGGFTYTPNSDVAGTDSFTYRAMNSVGPGNDALVNILIGAPLGPQPPTRLFTSSIEGNRVTLRWTPPVVGPTLEYRLEGGLQPGQVLATIATNNPYPIYSFEIPSGAFYVRVRTVSGDELSAPSNEIRVFVNSPVAPTPPSDLVGLASGSSLALTWRNTYGGATPTSLILDVTGSAITSVPLNVTDTFAFPAVPSGTYTFTLRAVNAAGTSAASNPVTLTFPSVCSGAPPTPANFLAYRIGRTLYALWDAAATGPAPTSYQIDISESFTGTFEVTSRSVHAPVSPGLYRISVRAKNICGVSLATAPWLVRVP